MTSRQHYLDSHPSLNASMDDFEAREFSPTIPEMPSQHSGFRSNNNSEYSETSSRRSYSPPPWRKNGSGWFKHSHALSPSRNGYRSKDTSPQYQSGEDDGDDTEYRTARHIPLPESPIKGRSPSNSPEPVCAGAAQEPVRVLFFEKKNQKTFARPGSVPPSASDLTLEGLFASFSSGKEESLPSTAHARSLSR